ncbi:MAG: EVE domain-containing protein [Bryobacterales bacterium]|nr:EVE domain-containing protein [Bryobacterales bacterium]
MTFFLAKTEPNTYSIGRFAQEQQTVWDGVNNAQAVRAIRSMKPGDRVLIYHSGGESQIVGLAQVMSEPSNDPSNPKSAIVTLKYLRTLEPPTTLHEVKASGLFGDFALVRQSRLSTMAVPDDFIDWLERRYPGQLR